MPPEVPMTSARVLVALAMIGGVPKNRQRGKRHQCPAAGHGIDRAARRRGDHQPQDFSHRHRVGGRR